MPVPSAIGTAMRAGRSLRSLRGPTPVYPQLTGPIRGNPGWCVRRHGATAPASATTTEKVRGGGRGGRSSSACGARLQVLLRHEPPALEPERQLLVATELGL